MQSEEDAKAQEKVEKQKKEQSLKQELQRKVDEAGKRQKKAAHADALSNYKTLLNETVKDIDARWSEWKPRLQRDPQARRYPLNGPANFDCFCKYPCKT